ncbi:FAD synthase [Mycoplasma todarodis]|uniref:FAD synthase n=1 Tax=Mycoplasma todarodis TaxID=1937191 RepID=A0A4R0XIN5_9MOLU|nr:adenylyltransferase/cytidyltransferase family protein [Mycoplasma todarodis]TCG10446.1 hypothetical protein C4B25_04190 [Mycoplasma todarodis]
MKAFYFPEKIEIKNPTIIMGSFDAIHIGHLELIKKAQSLNEPIIMMMFEKPYELPNKSREMFEQLEVRLQKLSNMDIDYAMVVKVDSHLLTMLPEDFMKELKETYSPANIVCGKDFSFGRGGAGNPDLLAKVFGEVHVVDMKKIANKNISTSIIKEQIPFGEIDFANSLLVAPWTTNIKIGKESEFVLEEVQIKPHSGFYAVTAINNDVMYHGVVHVTRQGKNIIHLLNNSENLQNKDFSISWWRQLEITIKDQGDELRDEHLEVANRFFKNSL